MGRQIRFVPANWEHPKNKEGEYIPLFAASFTEALEAWEKGKALWKSGFYESSITGVRPKQNDELEYTWEEWTSEKPLHDDYMPEFSEAEKTHIQLYENTTEGTPLSPVFKKDELELLCQYAADNCFVFAGLRGTKEKWMEMLSNGGLLHLGNVIIV